MRTISQKPSSFLTAKSYKLKASSPGFTIIETLVAIAILLLSLTAPLTIAEKGLASAEAARHEITAFYLAQEAVEYMRNIRDSNAISKEGNGPPWLQGLNECEKPEGCGIDVTAEPGLQIVGCKSENEDCLLYQYNGSTSGMNGLFGHRRENGWARTSIRRKIFLEDIQQNIEARITVDIDWTAGSLGPRTMTLTENIFNWYVPPEE